MIDSSAKILFQLLRAALGDETGVPLPDDVDWKEVIDLSFDQGVAALTVDGLQRSLELSAESLELALDSPELEDLKYEWFGSTFQAEEDYSNTVKAAEALAKKFPIVILKGLSIARKYPIPAHRESVDLDVFGLRDESLELRERVLKTLETFGMREFAEFMARVANYVCKEPSTELTNTDQRMLDDILSLGKKKRFKNGHLNMAYNILFRNGWKFRAFAKESNLVCLIRCGWNAIIK